MPDDLTDAWFDGLTQITAAAAPPDLDLCVEQVITGETHHRWQIRFAAGSVTVDRDPTDPPDVRITTDWETASGIRAGEISAQRAFLDGRLRIGGDIQALIRHREALQGLIPAPG